MSEGQAVYELDDLAPLVHQAALNPHLGEDDFNQICYASKYFELGGLCTFLHRLISARKILGKTSKTKLISVISFPFGDMPHLLKLEQAKWAIEHGAEELDVVPNFDKITKRDINSFAEELSEICSLGVPVRAILDIPNLNPNSLEVCINASLEAGVYGLQTGNGFGRSLSPKDIKNLVSVTRNSCQIKAVGGLHTIEKALEVIYAGASLIGTSQGLDLIRLFRNKKT